jgi:hypothetical protein
LNEKLLKVLAAQKVPRLEWMHGLLVAQKATLKMIAFIAEVLYDQSHLDYLTEKISEKWNEYIQGQLETRSPITTSVLERIPLISIEKNYDQSVASLDALITDQFESLVKNIKFLLANLDQETLLDGGSYLS